MYQNMANISLFADSASYTLDSDMKKMLLSCSKGKYPIHFRVVRGRIVTTKGNTYDIPSDPMDLCNLVHDIITGTDRVPLTQPISVSTRRNTDIVPEDAIYSYARRETKRLGKDDYHREQLVSCIFTALLLEHISYSDFTMDNDKILHIDKINTSIPCIENL